MTKLPIDIAEIEPYTWGDRCTAWPLIQHANFSVKKERMPPHTSEVLHLHEHSLQFFYILKGVAQFTLDRQEVRLSKDQAIEITPGTPHLISNPAEEELEFLVISQPNTTGDRIPL